MSNTPAPKVKYSATASDGQVVTRTSHRTYTHAVIVLREGRPAGASWAGRLDLAQSKAAELRRDWGTEGTVEIVEAQQPAATEAFTDVRGRAAARQVSDDPDLGVAAGSETLVAPAEPAARTAPICPACKAPTTAHTATCRRNPARVGRGTDNRLHRVREVGAGRQAFEIRACLASSAPVTAAADVFAVHLDTDQDPAGGRCPICFAAPVVGLTEAGLWFAVVPHSGDRKTDLAAAAALITDAAAGTLEQPVKLSRDFTLDRGPLLGFVQRAAAPVVVEVAAEPEPAAAPTTTVHKARALVARNRKLHITTGARFSACAGMSTDTLVFSVDVAAEVPAVVIVDGVRTVESMIAHGRAVSRLDQAALLGVLRQVVEAPELHGSLCERCMVTPGGGVESLRRWVAMLETTQAD